MGCRWAGGRITEAAEFVMTALERAKAGTEMLAILPDVLRSGSFSANWRNRVSELAEVLLVEPHGIFDDSADVDVFLLRLVRRQAGMASGTHHWTTLLRAKTKTIGDYFNVHVGPVVPHRDKEAGSDYPYIHARCVPKWTVMEAFTETRRYEGLVFDPPFVVIRRTSRPEDPYRATATIISGTEPIAVENHLLVCEPKNRTLKSCQELMKQLKTETVNKFLNFRIRCRHLTVGAVEAIPFSQYERTISSQEIGRC